MNEMREALVLIRERVLAGGFDGISPSDIVNICDAALAAPVRNCDVGKIKEQAKRKMEFCNQQEGCDNCPFSKCATLTQCALAWAQMLYEEQEGGNDDANG